MGIATHTRPLGAVPWCVFRADVRPLLFLYPLNDSGTCRSRCAGYGCATHPTRVAVCVFSRSSVSDDVQEVLSAAGWR